MKNTVLTIILFIITNLTNAQLGYGKIEDIKKLKEVPILVVLDTLNEDYVKKLSKSKKAKVEAYYSKLENFNKVLRPSFENYWSFSETIKFISSKEMKSYLSKSNEGKYAYFKLDVESGSNSLKLKGLITTYHYSIYLIGSKKPVYTFMYHSSTPNAADFKFILQQIQSYLRQRGLLKTGVKTKKELIADLNKSSKEVKNRMLLINRNDLSKGLLKKIGSLYKFKYKIISSEEIDKAILNEYDSIAYLRIIPLTQITIKPSENYKKSSLVHSIFIINPKNGKVLLQTKPFQDLTLPTILKSNIEDFKPKMKTRHLKNIIKKINN